MNYPAASSGVSVLELKVQLFLVQFRVGSTLILDIFSNGLFARILTYSVRIVSARPESSTPEGSCYGSCGYDRSYLQYSTTIKNAPRGGELNPPSIKKLNPRANFFLNFAS